MPGSESAKRNPDKGYVALLGWSLNAVEALDRFDRRYVVVAPDWAEEYCKEHEIPYVPWNFERLNDRSMEIAETLQDDGRRRRDPAVRGDRGVGRARSTRCCSTTRACSARRCCCGTSP